MDIKQEIIAEAKRLGFEAVGFARPELPAKTREGLGAFLSAGYHGTMEWLARNAQKRADPAQQWPEVKSIVMLGHNYGPEEDPLPDLVKKDRGLISVYARNEDYHTVIGEKLRMLAAFIEQHSGVPCKPFVDTAPVMEKPLAVQAGIGWQGKHTCLVSREYGSWLFLGSLFTALEIAPDTPEADHCGSCTRCLDICPTQAFPAPRELDARRCISYLTIEHKGHIAEEFRAPIGNRIYGCDDCLAVCPWNKFAKTASEARYHAREDLSLPPLAELLALTPAAFKKRFATSPILRIGRHRFVRNALIAAGNSGMPTLVPQIKVLLGDGSALVRAMAVWALGRLLDAGEYATLRATYMNDETDDAVRQEWNRRT